MDELCRGADALLGLASERGLPGMYNYMDVVVHNKMSCPPVHSVDR
jgi:hypothetical protein